MKMVRHWYLSVRAYVRLRTIVFLLIAGVLAAVAAPPAWWAGRQATNAKPQDDYAPLNQGQLKNLVRAAAGELEENLPGGAGGTLAGMVASWATPTAKTDDYAAVNAGQLKAAAKWVYDRCMEAGYVTETQYPWDNSAFPPDDYALANIGQAKNLFAFDLATRTFSAYRSPGGDGIAYQWKRRYGLDPTNPNLANEIAPGGITYLQKYQLGLNPAKEDSDGDGVKDGLDLYSRDPRRSKDVPAVYYAAIDLSGKIQSNFSVWGAALNDAGQAAFVFTDSAGVQHPFLWKNGTLTTLSTLAPADSTTDGFSRQFEARAINANGMLAGTFSATRDDPPNSRWGFFSFAGNAIVEYENDIAFNVSIYGLSENAMIAAEYHPESTYGVAGPLASPHVYGFDDYEEACYFPTTISLEGVVAGYQWVGDLGRHAAVGQPLFDIGTLMPNGSGNSEAFGVNDSHQVVGRSDAPADPEYGAASSAFLFSAGTPRPFRDIIPAVYRKQLNFSYPTFGKISNSGNILLDGSSLEGPDTAGTWKGRQFLWEAGPSVMGTIRRAQFPGGWQLDFKSINNSGLVLALGTKQERNAQGQPINNPDGTPKYESRQRAVLLLPVEMMVDANRDGEMSFTDAAIHDKDGTTAAKPYRFWLNNDHDIVRDVEDGDVEYDDANDGLKDSSYSSIHTERDLEDFTRLRITFKGLIDLIKNTEYSVYLEWRSMDGAQTLPAADGAPEIKVYQERQPAVRPLYLEDQTVAFQQRETSGGIAYYTWIGGAQPGQPMDLFWRASLRTALSETNPTVNLLFCGRTAGRGQLILTIKKGTQLIGQYPPVYIELLDIKDMYERWTVDGEPSTPPRGGSVPSAAAQRTIQRLPTGYASPGHNRPFAYGTTDPEEKKYILFVHGWNMKPMEKEQFSETAYKRLFWQGYKGRFGVFEWPTTHSFEGDWKDALNDPTNYDRGERRAWQSATPLRLLLAQINQSCPGEVHVLAHSMGNVVMGEALRLHSQHGSGHIAKSYVASQGAVPAHCYDGTIAQALPFWTNLQWIYNHPKIWNGTRNYGPATPDIYRNWFAFNGSAVGRRINFYNVNDFALAPDAWEFNQIVKPDWSDLPYQPWSYSYFGDPEQPPLPTGFYKSAGHISTLTILSLGDRSDVKDRYEIMSFAAEARSKALGATAAVFVESLDLQTIWLADPSPHPRNGPYGAHKWHSAQFLSTNMRQKGYWKALLGNEGFEIMPTPTP